MRRWIAWLLDWFDLLRGRPVTYYRITPEGLREALRQLDEQETEDLREELRQWEEEEEEGAFRWDGLIRRAEEEEEACLRETLRQLAEEEMESWKGPARQWEEEAQT